MNVDMRIWALSQEVRYLQKNKWRNVETCSITISKLTKKRGQNVFIC